MSTVSYLTTTASFESWFIIMNISMIIFVILAILLAIIFLTIVALNKTCQTLSIMLICNSCLAEIIYGSVALSLAIFTLENDMKQKVFRDALCSLRGYLGYVATALLLYSFSLQAIYRYITIVYPTHISWQSPRIQGMIVCFVWIFCIISLLPWFFTGDIAYDVDSQVCIIVFQLSVPIIYNLLLTFIIPVSIIVLIYVSLVRYIRQMSMRATSVQTIFQAKRDLIVVRRIVIIIVILLILGVPYTIFTFISFITKPPKYHARIAVFFLDLAQALIMIVIFKFCQPIMDVVLKLKRIVPMPIS